MKAFFTRFICRLLAGIMIAAPYAAQTQAALIGSEQAIAGAKQAERDKLRGFMARADIQRQLAQFGVSPASAAERANALTDEEVGQLAGRIDALPAGADISVAAALLIVLILLLLIFFMDRKR
jgi:hypothetical protein